MMFCLLAQNATPQDTLCKYQMRQRKKKAGIEQNTKRYHTVTSVSDWFKLRCSLLCDLCINSAYHNHPLHLTSDLYFKNMLLLSFKWWHTCFTFYMYILAGTFIQNNFQLLTWQWRIRANVVFGVLPNDSIWFSVVCLPKWVNPTPVFSLEAISIIYYTTPNSNWFFKR